MPSARIFSRTRLVAQRREERLHGRPLAAALDQQEIVVLGRDRQEAEPIEPRDRLDRDAPVGAALRHRGGDRVVRARLVAVAGRPRAGEQLVDQHARAGAGIAVDHQARRIGERRLDRLGRAAAREARVARPVDEALHALPALHQREARAQQMRVVDAARGIDEMHRREIAFAALGRRDAAQAADRDGARGEAPLGERAEHRVERDAMAAHDHEIGHRRGLRRSA